MVKYITTFFNTFYSIFMLLNPGQQHGSSKNMLARLIES